MNMDVYWDSAKAEANHRKHGVRFPDAELVLYDPMALTMEDPYAEDENRFVSLGRDATGRVTVVVYTYRDNHIRLISARRATRQEQRVYEKGI
jgi:uncharacterized DUF497 family protein